jgi:hypothetical protein
MFCRATWIYRFSTITISDIRVQHEAVTASGLSEHCADVLERLTVAQSSNSATWLPIYNLKRFWEADTLKVGRNQYLQAVWMANEAWGGAKASSQGAKPVGLRR